MQAALLILNGNAARTPAPAGEAKATETREAGVDSPFQAALAGLLEQLTTAAPAAKAPTAGDTGKGDKTAAADGLTQTDRPAQGALVLTTTAAGGSATGGAPHLPGTAPFQRASTGSLKGETPQAIPQGAQVLSSPALAAGPADGAMQALPVAAEGAEKASDAAGERLPVLTPNGADAAGSVTRAGSSLPVSAAASEGRVPAPGAASAQGTPLAAAEPAASDNPEPSPANRVVRSDTVALPVDGKPTDRTTLSERSAPPTAPSNAETAAAEKATASNGQTDARLPVSERTTPTSTVEGGREAATAARATAVPAAEGVSPDGGLQVSGSAGGPQSTQPAASQAAQVSAPPLLSQEPVPVDELFDRLLARANLQQRPGEAHFQARLKPEHLGQVDLQMSWERGVLTARFLVQGPETQQLLQQQLQNLEAALRDRGLNLGGVEVGVSGEGGSAPEDRSSREGPRDGWGLERPKTPVARLHQRTAYRPVLTRGVEVWA